MSTFSLPWQAWFREGEIELVLPDTWDVTWCAPADGPGLDDSAICSQIRQGFSAAAVRHSMVGKRTAAIAVDDITRPTPAHRVLPPVLDELAQAGIGRENVRLVVASGAHRPALRPDLVCKLGEELVNEIEVCVHNPYEGLVYLGETRQGTPIHTNRLFHEAELRLAVGSVLPHELAGFSGGCKTVAVGLSGMSTLEANHYRAWNRTRVGIGKVEDNDAQADFREIADAVGLDAVVNAVLNARREILDLFVGEPVEAHGRAVGLARQVCATRSPRGADIAILNAYPKDLDLIQATMALNVAYFSNPEIVRPGGTLVVTCACPEGAGIHFLDGFGMRRGAMYDEAVFGGRQLVIFSPNLARYDVHRLFTSSALFFHDWPAALRELGRRHPGTPRVSIFPCACQQLPFFFVPQCP